MYCCEIVLSFLSAYKDWVGGVVYWGERFPGVVILQFCIGMCFAHLLRRKHFLEWPHWAKVGDVIMLAALLLLFNVGNPRGPLDPCRCEGEAFFAQGMTPFIALYIYATSCNILTKTPQGYFSQLLTHNVMVGIGDFSFQVYLWQGPIANVMCGIIILFDVESSCSDGTPSFPGTFFASFLIILYLFSGWFAYKIEAPFIGWLTRATEIKPAAKPVDVEREDRPMISPAFQDAAMSEDIQVIFEEALQTRGRRVSFEQDTVDIYRNANKPRQL
jgi:peptidoglycan/LPS O-acetylase OafA/YrhL